MLVSSRGLGSAALDTFYRHPISVDIMSIPGSGIAALKEAGVPISTWVKRLLTAGLERANHHDKNELLFFVFEAMIRQFESAPMLRLLLQWCS